jgi:hypothetical protein
MYFHISYFLRFAGVCCLILGKWLILLYGGAACPWRLVVGVNGLLYIALVCFCITVNWEGDLVGLRPVVVSLGCMS